MIGGDGNNVYIINDANNDHPLGEIITGGSGSDVIRYTSTTATETLFLRGDVTGGVSGDTVVSVVISDISGAITGTSAVNVNANDLAATQTVSIVGNDGNNVLTANNDGASTLSGQGGNDTLVGGGLADYLMGGAGLDSLIGGNGVDTLFGGLGADWLDGGAGNDIYQYNNTGESTFTDLDVINWVSGDTIDLSYVASVKATNGTYKVMGQGTNLSAALNSLASGNSADQGLIVFVMDNGDTYAYLEAVGTGATYQSNDLVIKLLGVGLEQSVVIDGLTFNPFA
jgi:Ca2+-binding RTX toxin-like protein